MQISESKMSPVGQFRAAPDIFTLPETVLTNPSRPSFIDPLELESLALILEHSLKVHTSHHFYCWTQGLLQNLICHEVLICALRESDSAAFYVDTFSSTNADPALINNLFLQDTTLVPHLLRSWEENHFQPVFLNMVTETSLVESGLARELKRLGSPDILVHGTHDTTGRPTSFFLFACRPGCLVPGKASLAELLVPSLHTAWVHTQFTRPATISNTCNQVKGHDSLTVREHEILDWICLGKSNIEIGMILGISPLTVKNHVQKILRRLGVTNRAQAVGKAMSLRIIDGSVQR